MNRFIDYIEKSCANLTDNHLTYLYKKKLLDQMTDRSNEIIHIGLTNETVLTDLLKDELGNIEEGYKNFLIQEKKKHRAKLMKISFPLGGLISLILILITYFTVSDITGAWNKTWLIIVGGIFAMIIFYLSFAIKKLCHTRRLFHPIARVLIAGCVMLLSVFTFLFCLMMFPALTTWPILPAGVMIMLIADLIFAFATKQKFRTISLFVYMPAISTMLYILFAAYNVVTWGGGWPIILLGVAADVVYIFAVIMSNMKYFMYRQEIDE